jgi:hypothetical protein
MGELMGIPEAKKAGGEPSIRGKALHSIGLACLAGVWIGLGFHWLSKSESNVWVGYFGFAAIFLVIAVQRVRTLPR